MSVRIRWYLTLSYYVAWFAIVQVAVSAFAKFSFLIALLAILNAMFALRFSINQMASEFKIILIQKSVALFLVGIGFDFLSQKWGFISFKPDLNYGFLPLWLVSIWLIYFTILPVFFKMFNGKILSGAIFAAVFAPLSYMSGANWGLVTVRLFPGYFFYGLFWLFYFPISLYYLAPTKLK